MSYSITYYNPIEDEIQTASGLYDTKGLGAGTSQETNDRLVQGEHRVIYFDNPMVFGEKE